MTSLEERRRLLKEAGSKLLHMETTQRVSDIIPVMHAMMKFMGTMLEEDEANAIVNLLRREGMYR